MTSALKLIMRHQQDTETLASMMAMDARAGDIIALSGDLGAGKSVFARAYVRAACAHPDMEVPSPTFTLVQTYETPSHLPLMHADLYRLSGPEDVYDLGFDDERDDAVFLIEWPDRLPEDWHKEALKITLTQGRKPEERHITITTPQGWAKRLEALLSQVPTEMLGSDTPDTETMTGIQKAQAMVLAAGKGERMMPLTANTPKPLLPVAGKSILHRILDALEQAKVTPVVVNVHHLRDQMLSELAPYVKSGKLLISDEKDRLLETGGGVKKATPLLDETDFFVINADVIWQDGSEPLLTRMRRMWKPAIMDVLLLMIPMTQAFGYDGVGDFFMDFDDTHPETEALAPLRFRDEAPASPYMYGAVQIVKAELYKDMPGGNWSNRDIFRRAAARDRLFGLVHDAGWVHVGTPQALTFAEEYLRANWTLPNAQENPPEPAAS